MTLPRLAAAALAATLTWAVLDLIADPGNRELICARRKEWTWGHST